MPRFSLSPLGCYGDGHGDGSQVIHRQVIQMITWTAKAESFRTLETHGMDPTWWWWWGGGVSTKVVLVEAELRGEGDTCPPLRV